MNDWFIKKIVVLELKIDKFRAWIKHKTRSDKQRLFDTLNPRGAESCRECNYNNIPIGAKWNPVDFYCIRPNRKHRCWSSEEYYDVRR